MKIHKTALITGTSSGFGKRIVELMLELPEWRVVAGIRGGEERGRKVFSKDLLETAGNRLQFWDLHLDQPLNAEELSKIWKDRFGPGIDLLLNNAGYGKLGPATGQSSTDIRGQFEVNFFSPIALTQALLPYFPEKGGRVLNVSSICGLATFPFYSTYCSTKYALEAFTEALDCELRPRGIQFCLIEPGTFMTEFNSRVRSEMKKDHETAPLPARLDFAVEHAAFESFIESKWNFAGNPEKVAQLLLKLSTQEKIPLRVTVGPDAKAFAFLKRVLPTSIWVAIVKLAFRRILSKKSA